MASKIDEMYDNAINKSKLRKKREKILAKYTPKSIRTYEEDGKIITIYEAR